jgi:hypothetical protein
MEFTGISHSASQGQILRQQQHPYHRLTRAEWNCSRPPGANILVGIGATDGRSTRAGRSEYVSWHPANFPSDIDVDNFRLTVPGQVNQTLSLPLNEILKGLPHS